MAIAELPSRAIVLPRPYAGVPARSRPAPNLAWLPLVGVLLGLASLFYVAQTGEVAVTGYDIQEMQAEFSDWQMKNEQLALELSRARALSRIEAEAKGRMLMVPARDAVYLTASKSQSDRTAISSRGDSRGTPELAKPVPVEADPLDPVRSSVSLLLPRAQAPLR